MKKNHSKITLILISLFIIFETSPIAARYVVRPQDQAIFHNNRGVTFLNQGDLNKALFEFKIATEISKEYAAAWSNLGLTYMYLKKYSNAKEAFERAIKIDKKMPQANNHLGSLYYNQGDFREALKWVNKSIKYDKGFADGYYNKGVIYREIHRRSQSSKDAKESEEAFRLATSANSKHYLAHFELGKLYQERGQYEQALIRYKTALEIQPSATQIWEQLCNLYQTKGQTDRAQFACNKAVVADPKNTEAHVNLAIHYLNERNFLLAEKELKQASQEDPNNPQVLAGYAYAKLARAEHERAQKGISAAQGYYQEAINRYSSLLRQNPNFADAAYNLGFIYSRMGNILLASDWYQKTLNIDPNYSRALYGLGTIKIEQQQKKEGLKYLCRFVKQAGPDLNAAKQVAEKMIAQSGKCR